MLRPFLPLALVSLGMTVPGYAQDRPGSYVIASDEPGSWWKTEARVMIDWRRDAPRMTALECTITHDRYAQGDQPPMEIVVTHPVESGDYQFRFKFNLPDNELINRQVETITVGGRPYRRETIQSRIIPWVGGPGDNDIVLMYGIGRDMFRPNESYPWLPIEFLIPQFFEVEGIELGIGGDFEIEHGEYERRYEKLYIDMNEFKESMDWCYRHVNPTHEREIELSAELKMRVGKKSAQPTAK